MSNFSQPCFIRKNTPELRKKLEEFGYVNRNTNDYIGDSICTLVNYNPNISDEYMCFEMDNDFLEVTAPSFDAIDCGENEQLFLALAALIDGSDYMQWFTTDSDDYVEKDEWYLCEYTDWELSLSMGSSVSEFLAHKATVKELIEHFKK